MLRWLRPTDRALDVGSANGLHLRLVAPRCRSAVGIDVNEKMIGLARAKLAEDRIENAEVIRASATKLPFEDGDFDFAYSFSTLLLVDDLPAAVGEIARSLRPGGVAVLDLTGRFNLSQRHWRRWYREQGHPHLNALSLREARSLLRRAGLELEEVHGLGLTDQWHYVRGLARAEGLERIFHRPDAERDLDYRLSNLPGLRGLANRWYVVARRRREQ